MKKQNFAICDLEAEYACRLMDYIRERQKIPFEMLAFSEIRSLELFTRENTIEILLISSKAMCEEILSMNIHRIMILSEGEISGRYADYPAVYKYQSSESLVAEVMNFYASQEMDVMPMFLKRKAKILGVYSPIGRCGKTSFALTLGECLAKDQNVLYLNLENFSGFEKLTERNDPADLTDMMYFIRQNRGNTVFKLNAIAQQLGSMSYIPPAFSAADLQEIGEEEWIRMLDEVTSSGGYETVILDMGGTLEERLPLLSACSKIYTPILRGVVENAKLEHYKKLLKELDREDILDKSSFLLLPYVEHTGTGEYFTEQLFRSEMGTYVNVLMQKEEFL
ncbi:MAG: hypothetical protein ACI4EI_02715 [Muricoprocola sp.]